MLIQALRKSQILLNRVKRGRTAQEIELRNMEFELARMGLPPRAAFKEIKNLLLQNRVDEALKIAATLDLDNVLNVNVKRFQDFTAEERLVFAEARHVALTTPQAIVALSRAVDYVVKNKIPGDLVECGVFKGGSIGVILRTLLLRGVRDRDVYLFDTFEGMPKPDENDVYYTGESATTVWSSLSGAERSSDWVREGLDAVKARVLNIGYPKENIHFVKGLVEETLPRHAPEKIALLRLDTDFYASTKHEMVHLFPRLVRGGVMIIDDYGVFRGAQQAVDEYLEENKIQILLGRVDEAVRMAVKQ